MHNVHSYCGHGCSVTSGPNEQVTVNEEESESETEYETGSTFNGTASQFESFKCASKQFQVKLFSVVAKHQPNQKHVHSTAEPTYYSHNVDRNHTYFT